MQISFGEASGAVDCRGMPILLGWEWKRGRHCLDLGTPEGKRRSGQFPSPYPATQSYIVYSHSHSHRQSRVTELLMIGILHTVGELDGLMDIGSDMYGGCGSSSGMVRFCGVPF